MTEAEWATCRDPEEMLAALEYSGAAGERKLRLFAVACCRRVWHRLKDPRSRRAVEVAERFADGQATPKELRDASEAARDAWTMPAEAAAYQAARADALGAAPAAAYYATWAVGPSPRADESNAQAGLLRCVLGNPFKPPPRLAPAVLRWHDGTVRRIAEGIYEERAFDRMPILADALLDAGCDDGDILAHCCQPAEHAKGCWAIDLLLGKS